MMEDQIRELQTDVRELHKLVGDLRVQVAIKAGAHTATAWWAAGVAAIIAAWLGATSIWHIPSLVRTTASGEAQSRAQTAAQEAKRDADAIAKMRKDLADTAGTVGGDRDGCFTLGDTQVCWGTKTIKDRHKQNREVINIDFTFGKPFAQVPSIATGIMPAGTNYTDGVACAFGIYGASPRVDGFSGAAILVAERSPSCDKTPVDVSYVAVGKRVLADAKQP
jgi:hypothetical protein